MRLAQWGSHHEKLDGIGRLAHGFLGRLGPGRDLRLGSTPSAGAAQRPRKSRSLDARSTWQRRLVRIAKVAWASRPRFPGPSRPRKRRTLRFNTECGEAQRPRRSGSIDALSTLAILTSRQGKPGPARRAFSVDGSRRFSAPFFATAAGLTSADRTVETKARRTKPSANLMMQCRGMTWPFCEL